jgi:hypothetical protein
MLDVEPHPEQSGRTWRAHDEAPSENLRPFRSLEGATDFAVIRSFFSTTEMSATWAPSGDALAAHDDCDGRDSYRDMKKRYGNRQNMMEVFVAFAVPQLFLGLMFKRLTFGEKLLST